MSTWTPHDAREYERGFSAQMLWLTGDPDHRLGPSEPKTLDEARDCLTARLRTAQALPYNEGADDATRLYIERLEATERSNQP